MLGLGNTLIKTLQLPSGGSYVNEYSISFDGSNDYLETDNNFYQTFQNSFSISMWFKTPAAGAGTTYLASLYRGAANDYTYFFIKYDEANNRIHTRIQSNGYAVQNYTATGGIGDEAWVHLVYANSKGNPGVFDVYINGSADTTSELGTLYSAHQGFFHNIETTFRLANYGSDYGNCIIHDYAMFSSYLDANNAAAIYNSGTPINLSEDSGNYDNSENLVVYYRLNEGTGTEAGDSAGENPGTLTNGPTWTDNTPTS